MSVGTARRDRRVPLWLGGPLTSELAFRVFLVAFPNGIPARVEHVTLERDDRITNVELVERLADLLDEDEADVLRALAELEQLDVFTKKRKGFE